MAEHALPNMSLCKFPRAIAALFERNRSPKPQSIDAPEDSRSRRDFILEMLARNADAFQSELDIEYMAQMYWSRF